MTSRKCEVLLGIQNALLSEASSHLRAVVVEFGEAFIHFDAYYDGAPLADDVESMSCVETELIAMFPESHNVTHRVMRLDQPEPIPKIGYWVFFRREAT
jgi:hypothetical protein